MSEDDARGWIAHKFGDSAQARLGRLTTLVSAEALRQNLVARSTLSEMWSRHIVDSAQLVALVPNSDGLWIDVGSGAGFPGLVVAALQDRPVLLVEPRKRRASFLADAIADLGLRHATVLGGSIELCTDVASVISARAVAPFTDLLRLAHHCSTPDTTWVLPKGRSACEEVASARETWHGVFHVEHSVTDPASLIVIASGVSPR